MALCNWWEIGREALRPDQLGFDQPVVSHACEFETSMMLALRPDLVNLEKLKSHAPVLQNDWFHSEDDSGKRVAVFRRFHRFTPDGKLGHTAGADQEKGQVILEGVTNEIVEFLKDFATWSELPPRKEEL